MIGSFIASAQSFVSTTPENKNIILEEYTGISCGYCPDGHSIGQALHDANPNDVFLVNIHTGGYAVPQGAGTDFRVDPEGANLANQTGLTGYPSGTVNRHVFSGSNTALSRSAWSNNSTQLMSQPSPVNVAIQADVDMATNVLTVDVEVYYTGSQSVTRNKLNVFIVQNGILGPQSGGSSYNPSAIDPATGLYTHNHMLRYMMTGNWGATISTITQGTTFSNQYTWSMPSDINGVALDPTNIAVIAFVAEGQQEILSGTEVYPNIIFANQNDAYCMSSAANDAICADETNLDVTFRNYGNQNLTSLDINYSINGGSTLTYPWTGNLAPGGTGNVTIPNVAFSPQVNNTVSVSTANPNGSTDQNTTNDNASTSFLHFSSQGQVPGGFVSGNITIDVTTDQYGNETSWELVADDGTVIASAAGGSLSNSATQPTVNVPVNANECYSFVIYDSYGDGICCTYGNGSYTVKDAAGVTIASGGSFTTEEGTNFQTDGTATDINETTSNLSIYPNPVKEKLTVNGIYNSIEIYDIYGKLVLKTNTQEDISVSTLANGTYFVNINNNNKITVKKIAVTK